MAEETSRTGMQVIRFEGGVENTRFGQDLLNSDIVLKGYSLDLIEGIQGIDSYLKFCGDATKKEMQEKGHSGDRMFWLAEGDSKRVVEDYRGKAVSESKTLHSRFWFSVMDEESYVVEMDDVYVIEELRLCVRAETLLRSGNDRSGGKISEARDEAAEEFASQFTKHYDSACAKHPSLKRSKVLFDLVCLSEGMAHLGTDRPTLEHLIGQHRVEKAETQERYPLVQRLGVFSATDDSSMLVRLCGGIQLEAIIVALEDGDVSALKHAVLRSRPNARSLFWELPLDEWEMPNEARDCENRQQQVAPSATTEGKENARHIGCSLLMQTFLFDPGQAEDASRSFREFPSSPASPGRQTGHSADR